MQPKALLVFFVSMLLFSSARAQDTLYKRDGSIIAVKVKEVSPKIITYKRFDNLNGPEYTVSKNEVSHIKYSNGAADNFGLPVTNNSSYLSNQNHKTNYRKNILAVTPAAFIGEPDIESGVGIGISYEIALDSKKMLSVYLPVLFEFNTKYNGDDYYFSPPSNKFYNTLFFMPGVKFYPTGNDGAVRYSIGPSLYINTGKAPFESNIYNSNTGNSQNTEYDKSFTVFGLMLNNSLNISPTKHLYLGIDLGIGIPYIDNRSTAQSFGDAFLNPLVQFSFKTGYRF